MKPKWQTLQVIYDLVKNESHPCQVNLTTNEIISRLHFPWDEIVVHLHALVAEGYITMKQFSTAVISITEKGIQMSTAPVPV